MLCHAVGKRIPQPVQARTLGPHFVMLPAMQSMQQSVRLCTIPALSFACHIPVSFLPFLCRADNALTGLEQS